MAALKRQRFHLVSAVHLLLIRDGQILLLRRANTGYEDGNYSVVAGHLEGNETIKQASIREAREEVGIELNPQDLTVVQVMHRRSEDERIDWFLSALQWQGKVTNREPNRCDQLLWRRLDDLPDNVIPYVAHAIHNYLEGVWFDSFGWDS
ncbi:MAG: NUDIX domain-containing protein [Anaerolineales bacterium]